MAPKNKNRKPRTWPAPPRELSAGLAHAQRLADSGRAEMALDEASELARRYPGRPEPLPLVANLALELGQLRPYHWAVERLARLEPNDPGIAFGLAASYLRLDRPFLAFQALEQFLADWPEATDAQVAAEIRDDLAKTVPDLLHQLSLEGGSALDIAADHERVMIGTFLGEWDEARAAGERLLRQKPDFVRGMNNLCQVYSAMGLLPKAIEMARRVLTLEPENFHALGNLVRFYSMTGRPEEARPYVDRLLALPAEAADVALRQAEALSYLGDDAGVRAAVESSRELSPSDENRGLLPHLGAVAALRLGREEEARALWSEALTQEPGMLLARENLEDLESPIGERHGAWPFFLDNWVPPAVVRSLINEVEPVIDSEDEEKIARAARRVLRKHPELIGLIPKLLERGDPRGRVLALEFAFSSQTPEMFAALRDFATGPWGPDDQRMRAMQFLRTSGQLPPGNVRMWTRGEPRELHLIGFEVIREDRRPDLNPTVVRLLMQAVRLSREERRKEAAGMIQAAVDLQPDQPYLLTQLGNMQHLTGDAAAAEQSFRRAVELDPNYVSAVVGLAHLAIERRELEEAERLLTPLLNQGRIYQPEVGHLCAAYITLEIARERPDSARSWLEMWAGLDPENPEVGRFRQSLTGV